MAVIVALVVGLPMLVTAVAVMRGSDRVERFVTRLPEPGPLRRGGELEGWLRENEFNWVGAWRIDIASPIRADIWSQVGTHRHFAWMQPGGMVFDSEYVSQRSLETANSRAEQIMPAPPEVYRQTFSGWDLNELWQRHLQGEEFLERELGLRPQLGRFDHHNSLIASLRRETQYVRTLPCWWLRAPWWMLVRCSRRHNRPVAELYGGG